jgi:pimeloyl-ACP methyl ester carboxylesterase
MARRVQVLFTVVVLALLGLGSSPPSSVAASALSFTPCAGQPKISCTDLPVPLDRSGAVPGTIALAVARKLAGSAPSSSAVLALAGGPGQPAVPFAEFNAQTMAPALHSRDLLVFDQRGTGDSDPLSCPALESGRGSLERIFQQCAEQIGRVRGAFTTQESVQDIEALRRAAGYSKLVLYGTSYGTKVALEYAERYPQHVEAMVLDSVVPSDGPDPFAIPTFEALPGVLRELCSQGACTGITPEPVADLTALIASIRRHPLAGSVYDGLGHRHDARMNEQALLDVLLAGDLNPALRALLPAAIRSALAHDPDPLLRLQALAEGLIPNVPVRQGAVFSGHAAAATGNETDEALFVVTTCEEAPFPWQRAAPPATRLAEAVGFLRAQPASEFAPFDQTTALRSSLAGPCAGWPYASSAPPAQAPLPDVPTLILSGAQDLRTPTSNAVKVAARIPGSSVVVVPFTGHSVIGSDLTGCAAKALQSFFAGAAPAACTEAKDVLGPTPVTPRRLSSIRPPSGLGGKPGRTLVAALDTIVDLNRQVIAATLQAESALPNGASFGGLHGGYARLSASSAVLHDLSFVPGVRLSGAFVVKHGRLLPATIRVSGPSAAAGSIRLGSSSHRVTGTLGGRRFSVSLARVRLSRAGAGEWPGAAPALSAFGRTPLDAGAATALASGQG